MRPLPPQVKRLGWVSLFTDAGSEAIYPLLPFFITTALGGTALALGIVEGIAEGTNSLLRLVSGRVADRTRARRALVVAGYSLSSAVRPLIGLATAWTDVAGLRFADRIGKGVRSAPRDALLAESADASERGRIFGFHRAMDHAGAVIGPVAATLFLWLRPGQYRELFMLTAVPGVIVVLLVLGVRDTAAAPATRAPGSADRASSPLPRSFHRYLWVLALFTLGNSTDAFLLLRLTDVLGGPRLVPLVWAAHHVVKSALSTRGGALSDRVGRKPVIAAGWLVYAVVYLGFAFSTSAAALVGWMLVYGAHFALAEGSEKALVADLAPAGARGTAFGLYHALTGLGALAASLLFGLAWTWRGPVTAFVLGASLALVASVLLWMTVEETAGR